MIGIWTMECCLKSDYIIRNNTATFASYGQEEENKKYDNYIRGFEPGQRHLDRHWNGFLLTSRGEKYQQYQDSEMNFQSKSPGFAPHAEWVFIFWFKSDHIIRNNTLNFASTILLALAVHKLKLNDTEKSNMALAQGCNTESWKVPHFLSRITPLDRIGGEKSKNMKTDLGIWTQDQDTGIGI